MNALIKLSIVCVKISGPDWFGFNSEGNQYPCCVIFIDARLGELAYMCGGSTTPSTTTEKITPVAGPGEDNLGLIIGLAIAGVIIIIFAVILIIIFMRIRKTKL